MLLILSLRTTSGRVCPPHPQRRESPPLAPESVLWLPRTRHRESPRLPPVPLPRRRLRTDLLQGDSLRARRTSLCSSSPPFSVLSHLSPSLPAPIQIPFRDAVSAHGALPRGPPNLLGPLSTPRGPRHRPPQAACALPPPHRQARADPRDRAHASQARGAHPRPRRHLGTRPVEGCSSRTPSLTPLHVTSLSHQADISSRRVRRRSSSSTLRS